MKSSKKNMIFIQRVRKMPIPDRLYVLGFLSLVLFGLISLLTNLSLLINIFISLAIFLLALGFIFELIQYIGSIWGSKFASVLTFVFGLFSIAFLLIARTQSLHIINSTIPVDPSNFPLSSQILTYFMVIILWLVLAALVLELLLVGTVLRSSIESDESKQGFRVSVGSSSNAEELRKEKSLDKSGPRGLGIIAIVVIIGLIITKLGSQIIVGTPFVRTLIARTDHYAYSICSNYNSSAGERVAFLDNNKISVAIPDEQFSFTFEIRDCEP